MPHGIWAVHFYQPSLKTPSVILPPEKGVWSNHISQWP
jgi:hypothetical protein